MVGEIRDEETANIAVHAALTGHLVFSTLHTNDAIGAISRMLDMGVEPYLIRASLSGVLGQRLVRKLCQNCKETSPVPAEVLEGLEERWRDRTFLVPVGCDRCRETGYLGRTGIAELLVVTREIRNLMAKDPSRDDILDSLKRQGYITMREEGIRRAAEGITSLEEILRVTQDVGL
jgi:type II secretory ATPase GspE/PulE/Tfp pilus assembly ATPase PilB-like protein